MPNSTEKQRILCETLGKLSDSERSRETVRIFADRLAAPEIPHFTSVPDARGPTAGDSLRLLHRPRQPAGLVVRATERRRVRRVCSHMCLDPPVQISRMTRPTTSKGRVYSAKFRKLRVSYVDAALLAIFILCNESMRFLFFLLIFKLPPEFEMGRPVFNLGQLSESLETCCFSRKPRLYDSRNGAHTRRDPFRVPQILRGPARDRSWTGPHGKNHRITSGRSRNFQLCSNDCHIYIFQTFHLNYVDLCSMARLFVDEPEHWPKLPAPTD